MRRSARTSSGALRRYGPLEAIEQRLVAAFRYCKQCCQAFTCLDRNASGEHCPQAFLRTIAQAGDVPFENRNARKQHLMRDEPRCGPVEQGARSVCAGPAQSIASGSI